MKFQNKILAANFLCLFFWNVSFGNYDLVQFPEEYLCQMWGDEPDFVDEVDKIGDNGWKCIVDPKADKKGCKPKRLVCNNFTNCLDATDENRGCYIDKKSSDDNCYTWHFDVYQKYCLKYNPHNERCYNVDLEEFKPSESECIESSSFSYCQKLDKRWKDVIEYDLANEISDSYDWTSGCYHCWSGESIPKEWVCDGQKNCHDGSDESPDKGCKAIRDNGECTQHLNKKEENKTCIGDEFGSGFCDFYSNSIGTCLNCSSFWIENCTEANFKTAKGKQQCDYKCNGTLKTYQKKACHLPNILKSLIDDYSEEGTAFAEVIGLRASSMGSDLASECGEIIVIDVDNCPEAIDYRKNELRIKPTERYRKECAWILLSKHGSQISVDLPESYAANTLTFCDGPVTDNDKPCNLSGSIQVRSSNNTMSVRYRSEAQHDGKEIIIPYKSTDATDCKLDVLCYTKQNATWGGKTCGKVRPQCYTRNVGVLIGVVVLIIAGIFVVIFGFEPNYNDIYDKMMCQSCKDLVDTCEDVPLAKHTIKNFKMKWIYPVQSLPCFYLLHFYLHCRSAKRSGTKSNEHEPQLRRKNTSVNEIKGDPSEKHLASQCSHSSEKVIAVDINDDPEDQATGSTLPDNANDRLLTLNEHNSLDALKVKGELKYCESMTSKNGRFKVVMHASCFNGFKIYRNRIRGYEDYENLWAVDNNEELQSSNWQLPYRVKLGKHSIKIKVIGGQKKQISNDENPIIKIDMYHSLINEKITHIKMGDDGYIEFYSDKPRKIPRKKELNDYTMLVIGKVGAGKSTLCNILSGRKHDADDFETSNSIKSKTKAVEIKRVWFLKEELNPFVLIDTPGLGDPEILNQDEQMQKMNAEIGNLSHINLFVVCVDGGTNYRADSLFVKMMRDFKETFKFKMEGNEIVEDASIFWSRCVIAFTKVRTINCPKCDFKFPLKPEAERVQEYRQLLREQFKCDYEGNSHQAKSFDNHITKMQFINTDAGEHVLKQLYEKLIDPAAPKILAESMKKYAEQKRLSQEKTGSDFAYASNEGGLGELKIDVVEHEHVPISDGDIISSDEDSDLSLDQISHERNDGSSNNWKFKVSNISAVLDRSLGNIKTMFRNKQSDEFPGTELDDLKVEGDEQDPLVDDVEIRNEGIAEETHAPSEPFILQTSHKFLKAKIVVNLTPEYVKSPLDQVITINCDPVAVPKYPYSYDLSFTNSSDNVTTNVDVPQNGKIFFRDIDLQPGDYKYNIVVKGKTDHTELEGWKTELFKIYPGPSVQRQLFGLIPRHYSAVIAKNNVKLWEKSDHIIKNLPKSEILNDTILFRLPELTARNSSLTITTIKPSTVFICQGEEKRAAWNEDTLIQGRYAFCKHNEKVTTSNGDLSIFYANTDPNDNRLVITLPKTAPTNSSISIFVKEIQLNQESPNIKEIEGTCTNDENHPNHSTKNIANNANLINNTNTSSDGDRSGNTNTVSDEDQSVVCFKDFKKSSNGDTIASEQPNHLLEVKKENVDDLESSFEDKDGDWNME